MKSLKQIVSGLNPLAFDAVPKALTTRVPNSKQFYHSGDLGDIIYALPAIRAMGGGTLFLGPATNWKTREKITPATVERLKPLLKMQLYVHDVVYTDIKPVDAIDLNQFREYLMVEHELMAGGKRRLNLAEAHLYVTKQPLSECDVMWMAIDKHDKIKDRPIVFARTHRWRNDDFPWQQIVNKLGKWAVFVGFADEHEDFVKRFGFIPHAPTPTVLDMARLVNGAYLFVGNQSFPYAIREATKGTSLVEVWADAPNCLFMRESAAYGERSIVYSPRVTNDKLEKCPVCEANTETASVINAEASTVKCPDCGITLIRKRLTHDDIKTYRRFANTFTAATDPAIAHTPLPPSPVNVITRKSFWAEEVPPIRKPMWLARRTEGHETVFYMSGDLGDIIYALPTIRALGGGQLCIGPARDNPYYWLREPMTRARFDVIQPLLAAQKAYLSRVFWSDTMNAYHCHVDLNDSRRLHREPYYRAERNLADVPAIYFQIGQGHWRSKWLEAPSIEIATVIFGRSTRYHAKDFPWAKLVERYRKDAAFVGLPDEHAAFTKQFGEVQFYPTKNLLEVARAIAGAKWFIGNQSSPLAIAEGLKVNCVRENFDASPNCIFDRPGHTSDPACLLC